MRPSEAEQQVRSAGRLVVWTLAAVVGLVLVLVVVAAGHHQARPLAPCPAAQCQLRPHQARTVAP